MSIKEGMVEVDTFDRRVAEMEGKTNPPGLAHVICEEPKTGSWSRNSNLGIEAAFAPSADNRQTILKCPEWGFPETWTISLGIVSKEVARFSSQFNGRNITAIIEFGVGGFTQTIEVDWKLGTQITLVTNSINVIAEFANIDVGIDEEDFKLSVQLCRGNRPSSALAPTKTLVVPMNTDGNLDHGTVLEAVLLFAGQTTGGVNIPSFATMLHIEPAAIDYNGAAVVNGLYTANTVIKVISGPGAAQKNISVMDGVTLLALGSKIPVFGSSLQVVITNFAAGPGNEIGFSLFAELAG
jgi:hypothetical protein